MGDIDMVYVAGAVIGFTFLSVGMYNVYRENRENKAQLNKFYTSITESIDDVISSEPSNIGELESLKRTIMKYQSRNTDPRYILPNVIKDLELNSEIKKSYFQARNDYARYQFVERVT